MHYGVCMRALENTINDYVETQLSRYRPNKIPDPKIFHDSILGSNVFLPHEITVLDTPIIQRLRRISQVDLVPFVFPSGNHNRFEHTLGVTTLSGRLVNALFERADFLSWAEANKICKQDALNHVRMAAILHDCGHGPFSHMSEEFLLNFADFVELQASNTKFYSVSKHEIMSYLVARCPAMKAFFKQYIYGQYGVEIDLDFVSDIIIGHTLDYREKAFLVDVVNGAFDADKLDYIQRDSHFTGIKMVLDVDRLFHTINMSIIDGEKRLTVDMSGVNTLEQIVFAKMMLICTVYQHHKVRAAECLVKSILDRLLCNNSNSSAAIMLTMTDTEIYALTEHKDKRIACLAEAIVSRRLPKRAFVMSNKIISQGRNLIMDLSESWDKQKKFAEAIAEMCSISAEDVWVDIKKEPKFSEASKCPVRHTRFGTEWTELSRVFPIDAWIKTFSENKWKAYVFTWPEYRQKVFAATSELLKLMGVEFNEDAAKLACKMEAYDAGLEDQ